MASGVWRLAFQKPVIAMGIFDSKLQGLPPAEKNRSGVHNLTYILWYKRYLERELDVFYNIYPYQKIGLVFYGEVLNLLVGIRCSCKLLCRKIELLLYCCHLPTRLKRCLWLSTRALTLYISGIWDHMRAQTRIYRGYKRQGHTFFWFF